MKRKLILVIFLFIVSFIFIPQIKASVTCYYSSEIAYYYNPLFSGSFENCVNDPNCHVADETNLTASFIVPDTYNADKTPKLNATYSVISREMLAGNVKRNVSRTADILNWNKSQLGADKAGSRYVRAVNSKDENACPGYIVFTGGIGSLVSESILVSDKDEAENVIKKIVDSELSFKKVLSIALGSQYYIYKAINTSSNATKEEEIENNYTSCLDFKDDSGLCETNPVFSCLWVKKNIAGKKYEYCNFDDLTYVKCGDAWDIPSRVPGLISFLVNILKIATPIILIVVSVIALLKAVASSKEDAIKKAQSSLIRKLIAAAIVFFVVQITQFVILKVADSSEKNNISTCLSCMLNNDCSKNIYYKTKVGSNYECTPLTGTFNGECH